jgi:hypothetical protein
VYDDVVKAVCPENKKTFANISLSRRTIHHKEKLSPLLTQLRDTIKTFVYFSVVFHDRTDANNTAQLLIFTRGVKKQA